MPTHPPSSIISLEQATNLLPKPPSRSTLWRWCTRGVNGVKLVTFKVGQRRVTTVNHFLQFIGEMSGINSLGAPDPPAPSNSSVPLRGGNDSWRDNRPASHTIDTSNFGADDEGPDDEDDKGESDDPWEDEDFESTFTEF
jgi:hypothetical protein